ncbi:MAG: flavodoxin [Micromonosporaceae bacterium]|nr:flavodoxin [Micromonosporaceae bacterium]
MAVVLVIYESLFGNARTIATAVAAGLRGRAGDGGDGDVAVVDVGGAPTILDTDVRLLVVGGPNHQFGMTRPASRRQAIRDFGADTSEVGLREWLSHLAPTRTGCGVAVFETRLDRGLLRRIDQTTRTAERRLRAFGYTPIAPAEHFFVQSITGPLLAGESDRATRWGRTLAEHPSFNP